MLEHPGLIEHFNSFSHSQTLLPTMSPPCFVTHRLKYQWGTQPERLRPFSKFCSNIARRSIARVLLEPAAYATSRALKPPDWLTWENG